MSGTGCGIWLYRFLIIAFSFTVPVNRYSISEWDEDLHLWMCPPHVNRTSMCEQRLNVLTVHHVWTSPHRMPMSYYMPCNTICNVFLISCHVIPCYNRGARWLSGRVSDSGARGPGFETYRRRVVSLSKTLYSPKVLVNYPGSDGSVPIWLKNCWLGR